MDLPDRVERDIRKKAITTLLNQKNHESFIKDFRNTFAICNGCIHRNGYCSECHVSIPTMIEVTKDEYTSATHEQILKCRVCGRESRYSVVDNHMLIGIFIFAMFCVGISFFILKYMNLI